MTEPLDRQQSASYPDAALVELVNLMLTTPNVDDLLGDVARLAAAVITPPAACGITLRRNHHPVTVATNDPLAAHVDEVQYGLDEGPCLESLRTGTVVDVPDLATETRWGGYRTHALSYGVRSSLSLPLTDNGDTRGALNLYATLPHAFEGARENATRFADRASAALTLATRQAHHIKLSAQLGEALASRSTIDQAIGVIMTQQRCDADQAFEVLRTASQHQNRKLRLVAALGGRGD